jgi:hypothetical protein
LGLADGSGILPAPSYAPPAAQNNSHELYYSPMGPNEKHSYDSAVKLIIRVTNRERDKMGSFVKAHFSGDSVKLETELTYAGWVTSELGRLYSVLNLPKARCDIPKALIQLRQNLNDISNEAQNDDPLIIGEWNVTVGLVGLLNGGSVDGMRSRLSSQLAYSQSSYDIGGSRFAGIIAHEISHRNLGTNDSALSGDDWISILRSAYFYQTFYENGSP